MSIKGKAKTRPLENFGAERVSDTLIDPANREAWMNHMLGWANINLQAHLPHLSDDDKKLVGGLIGLVQNQQGALPIVQEAVQSRGGLLFARAANYVAKNLRKAAANLLRGQKKKKYLTILASMGVGVVVGVILGTVVFPGIGSAIGGSVGAAIGGLGAGIGGAVLFGTVGAAIGTWAGKRLANRFEVSPKDYKIKTKLLNLLKGKLNLSEDDLGNLRAYLVNRAMCMKEPALKQALGWLNKGVFEQASPEGMNRLGYYLAEEYRQLMRIKKPLKEHLEDLAFVRKMLGQLQESPELSQDTKTYLRDALSNPSRDSSDKQLRFKEFEDTPLSEQPESRVLQAESITPSRKPIRFSANELPLTGARGASFHQNTPLSSKELHLFEQKFQQGLMEDSREFKHVGRHVKIGNDEPGHRKIHYHCHKRNGEDLKIVYKETKNSDGVGVQCYAKQPKGDQKETLAVIFAKQAKAYMDLHPEAELVILAGGQKEWAIALMAEALKEGLNPQLNEAEFPKAQEALREEIISQAYDLAGLKPKKAIGVKFNN